MGQVINYHLSSKPDVAEVKEPHPTVSLGEEIKPTIPPYPKWFSESFECPGKVAINIPGLQLPSRQVAETSQTKSDVQH